MRADMDHSQAVNPRDRGDDTLLLPTNVMLDTSTAIERAEEEAMGAAESGFEGLHFVDEDNAKVRQQVAS